MSPRTLLYLYGWRLRAHPFQELLAGAGIAIGVALLFAVQVANHSITGSVEQLLHAITGNAQLELAARDDQGLNARLLDAVRLVPGVVTAAPTLEHHGVIAGPGGSEAIELIGVDPSLAALDGPATREFGSGRLSIPDRSVIIPDRLAHVAGVEPGDFVTIDMAGRAHRVRVAALLHASDIGPLTGSSVVIAPLGFAQRLLGMPGRLSRVLIHARTDRLARVRATVTAMAAGRLDVGPADSTVSRLESASAPNDQSTALFSGISAMIGVLFAFNAMLLTLPDRRAFVAELRIQGFTTWQVVGLLVFEALLLGTIASLGGLLFGDLLSGSVFHAVPTYLAFTFPIGTQRVVAFHTVALAFASGLVASLIAASRALMDVTSRRATDDVFQERGETGERIDASLRRKMLIGSLAIVLATTVTVWLDAGMTIVGVMALGVAVLLAIPAAFARAMPLVDRLARRLRRNLLLVAVMGARSAMTRSVAVAAIAALAVFGSVAIDGARGDLVRGLGAGFAEQARAADVWVTTAGRSLTTDAFPLDASALRRIREAPEVRSVRLYQGGMLDISNPARRIWVLGRPSSDPDIVPPSQIVSGDPALVERRLRAGGWAAASRTIADTQASRVGGRFELATPSGTAHLRLAAIVTNLGWGSGAVILNTRDYRRYWQTDAVVAIGVDLAPGVSATAGRRAVRRALGPGRGFDVETAQQFEAEFNRLLQDGLTRLSQISLLLMIAATLALSAALSAALWQRRPRLAAQKVQGFKDSQLRRTLVLEAVLVLLLGCVAGAIGGAGGHLLGNRWLELTTGFPAPYSLQVTATLTTLLTILGGVVVTVATVGTFAVRVPPGASFGR
ncbi:MAG: FtsX-like permease family protein [Actinobacteria bacterium]|nr:FtsX-like permease family protein [Actinomycetota bacterium]